MTDEEHGAAFKMGESFGFDAGYEAGQAAKTPPATAADINMLWAVIDELRGRIDALEGRASMKVRGDEIWLHGKASIYNDMEPSHD